MTTDSSPHSSVDCLGVHVARRSWADFRRWFDARLQAPPSAPPSLLFIVNAHTLNLAWGQPAYRALLNQAELVLNDGVGLEMATALEGHRFEYNFNGTDLYPRLFQELSAEGRPLRLFLYGAAPGRAELAARHIQERFPTVQVVGTLDGYQKDDARIVATINAAQPDLLLVAKGNPLQEEWLHAHAHELQARVASGVGALIDFLSGNVSRAPGWVRAAKMEWVYRLALEPRRMFRRYVVGNPLFLARSVYHQIVREL